MDKVRTPPTNMNMKRAIGYLGMAVIGGLLSLFIHQKFIAPPAPSATAATGDTALPVRYVNLPGPAGNSLSVPDFTEAAERTVNAVVHVTT